MCQSGGVRVATFNLLHGVPLRDHADEPEAPSPSGWRVPAGSLAVPADADLLAGPLADEIPEVAGIAPTERPVWSPEVADPAELLRAVEELLADGPIDVIALQEVDRYQSRTAGVDQAALVADAIGAKYWRFVPSVRGTPGIASEGASWVPATEADDLLEDEVDPESPASTATPASAKSGTTGTKASTSGRKAGTSNSRANGPKAGPAGGPRYGIALISRYPVHSWRVKRFPPAPVSLPLLAPNAKGRPRAVRVPDEPRSAVSAVIELPHTDVTIATAHLTFVPGYNTRQLNELRSFLAGQPRPMVLLGDFNTPGGIPGLVTGWHQVARTPTYPVGRPRVQFDHILADGWEPKAVAHARDSAHAVPLPVSDHCALVAEFPDE